MSRLSSLAHAFDLSGHTHVQFYLILSLEVLLCSYRIHILSLGKAKHVFVDYYAFFFVFFILLSLHCAKTKQHSAIWCQLYHTICLLHVLSTTTTTTTTSTTTKDHQHSTSIWQGRARQQNEFFACVPPHLRRLVFRRDVDETCETWIH